ncbi:lipoprotein signal peptidase [Schleiferia thermophila]|uniref:Lipoprotein signal peptidase n=1 Tax=Schleiferia thermophila TaxID=884107 RepID=A0A368ZZ82_9FLAO|nr:lipoprotein signal peptidase [Schleiferia thermophila]KFD38989.1 peptidase A8 [Schleiferia thermophila str. Yellowstone]PMB30694.1 lipoprotein signal peptidase [Fischerella thermalis CCMEE 5319]RCX02330.1 signal peptidase II [Schleiferia thermophila]GCD80786.1 lipoprotein signal peptidase [Schleiferia thermophila]
MRQNLLIVALILLADQALKIWVKLTMMLGQEHRITDWFILHFTENPGMAFGLEWGGDVGKYLLTIFRIAASVWIFTWLVKLNRNHVPAVAQISVALVLAGAVGNLIDSLFYGLLFDHSYHQVATLFPKGGGYAGFMLGHVVDMFYFPLIHTTLPDWIPFWGGKEFLFFQPIFNIADASITVGVGLMIVYQRYLFEKNAQQHSVA